MPVDLKRYQQSGHLHFLTFSCYRRTPLLDNDELRIVFERSLERLRRRHQFFVFGYVLMPEHVHLLLSEPKRMLLSRIIGSLKTEVSRKATGPRPFWQRRYYDFNVITHGKFVEKLRYMHRNPVKRGLVEKPEDWPWSSFRHWLLGEAGRIEIESHWTWNKRHPGFGDIIMLNERSLAPHPPMMTGVSWVGHPASGSNRAEFPQEIPHVQSLSRRVPALHDAYGILLLPLERLRSPALYKLGHVLIAGTRPPAGGRTSPIARSKVIGSLNPSDGDLCSNRLPMPAALR